MPTTSRGSRRDFAALEARRFQAAELFARGESQAVVARIMGVTTAAANHWHQTWQAKGRSGLKAAGRAGRKPRLTPKHLARIERALRAGPRAHGFSTELWTLPRIAQVIERLTGVEHHPGHVWRVLRGLGWSLQRPARRARERDEAAIAEWKTRRWTQLKKTPDTDVAGSSSRTKAAFPSTRLSGAPGPRAGRRRS
jgi:transposase